MILTHPDRRWWIACQVLVLVGFITVLCFIASLGTIGLLSLDLLTPHDPDVMFSLRFLPERPIEVIVIVATIACLVYVPWLMTLPLVIPVALGWRDPARILVFRRFHRRRENAALRHIVVGHLARFGHVLTLADTRVKTPWYVRFPVLLGQSTFMHFRPRRVRRAQDLDRLDALLCERRWLNVNWLLSIRKIFPVACSDELWQRCIARLLPTATLVLIDVSQPSESLAWELAECKRMGVTNRVVAIANRASPAVTEAGAVPVYHYRAPGRLDDPAGFAAAVRSILAQNGPAAGEAASWRQLAPRLGLAVGVMVLFLSIALFAASPYLFPDAVARWSPFSWQVAPAYLAGGDPIGLERLDAESRDSVGRAMIACLARPSCEYHRRAAEALPRLATPALIPSLVELMRQRGRARDAAIHALVAVGAPDLDLYAVEWLSIRGAHYLDISARALDRRATRRTAVPLIKAVSDLEEDALSDRKDDADLRLDDVLGWIVDAQSLPALLAARPRAGAAKLMIGHALAQLYRGEAAPHLLDALEVTEDHWISPKTRPYEQRASAALAILVAQRVAPPPQAIAGHLAIDGPSARWTVRLLLLGDPASAAAVLGAARPSDTAVEELATLAGSSDPAVRDAVASRLASSGPWLRSLAEWRDVALRLLALSGDFASVAPAFELARRSEPALWGLFGTGVREHPDAGQAIEILELLAAHVHPPCSPGVALRDDDLAEVVTAYERVRAKCRRARSPVH